MIADKDNIVYSLEKSINDLEKIINISIKNNNLNSQDIYASLGTVLLWIGSCLDRLREIQVDYSTVEKDYVQAFRGAYDAQKHSVLLIKFENFNKGGCSFPITFPLSIPSANYYFKELDENIINNKKEIKKYNKVLSNKSILLEVRKIQKIILLKLENL